MDWHTIGGLSQNWTEKTWNAINWHKIATNDLDWMGLARIFLFWHTIGTKQCEFYPEQWIWTDLTGFGDGSFVSPPR